MKQVLISAGEPSGDSHASFVAQALLRPGDIALRGIGGPALSRAGVSIDHQIDTLSVMGTAETLSSLPRHVRILRQLKRQFREGTYDLVILVDYPEFNLRVARMAHRHGIPVLYYVAPQAWAWRRYRVNAIRRYVTRLAVILPFELEFFGSYGVNVSFVGHPVLDWPRVGRHEARSALGLDAGRVAVGLFPGSRRQEVNRMWPDFLAAARKLEQRFPGLAFILSRVEGATYPGSERMDAVTNCPHDAMAAADVVLCKSGTTTLHAAVAERPMVIAYRTHPLTYFVGRRLARVDSIGLVNLVAGGRIVPELLQRDATPQALSNGLAELLAPTGKSAGEQRAGLRAVAAVLGEPGAGGRVAAIARELLN